MNCCVLMGSPRKMGNTQALLTPFVQELEQLGHNCTQFSLYDMDLRPCTACKTCQKDWTVFGCPQADEMSAVFDALLSADLIVLATPIYSWYCTPPMKAVLDRMVYGMNKFYGEEYGPALWEGKSVIIVTTCGYRPEKGADLLEEGIRRYCRHSHLNYLGMLTGRHPESGIFSPDEEKMREIKTFAQAVTEKNEGPV